MSFTLQRRPFKLRSLQSLPLLRITCNYYYSTTRPGHTTDHIQTRLPPAVGAKNAQRFREFNLEDRVIAITGGARGLGLCMAEALMEAGAHGQLE